MRDLFKTLLLAAAVVALSGCQGELSGSAFDDLGPTGGSDGGVTGSDTEVPVPAVCGNGAIEGDETCDGTCPDACDDGNTCTADSLQGSAATCDAVCSYDDITMCADGDGCCPDDCDATTDSDCSATCGDGVVDDNETCDGNCPTSCTSSDACVQRTVSGSPDRCNVQCSSVPVTMCIDADGCCPAGCTRNTDSDCGAVCGNGVIEGVEICDGDCPTSCDDNDACTADTLDGSDATCDAVCSFTDITRCVDGDGCCPANCTEVNDDDCAPVCGNDVVETGEACDGSCPTDCNDGKRCTADTMSGDPSTCDVQCQHADIIQCIDNDGCCPDGCDETDDSDCSAVCGNGTIESGETCDPQADCPTSCDDANECTTDVLEGSATTCDAVCIYTAITMCIDDDGCCPTGCNANTDNDCTAMCGNQVVESNETCDPVSSCPMDVDECDDNDACTGDTLAGDPASCTAECVYNDVTACIGGDGCCPSGCDSTDDSDCTAVCGNDVVEDGETCDPVASCPTTCDDSDACTDDTLIGSATSCTAACQYIDITMCIDDDGCCPDACDANTDTDCSAVCDNGVVEAAETCDPISSCPTSCDDSDACTIDNLSGSADMCTAECTYTDITMCIDDDGCCPAACNANDDNDCSPVCGNSVLEQGETCDPSSSCPQDVGDCDDTDACTTDGFQGDPASCTAECTYSDITSCTDNDGCCPATCTYNDDNDCPMVIDCTDPATWPAGWATLEDEIFAETNARRTQPQTCGNTSYPAAPAFNFSAQLQEAARCHTLDMITNDFFDHIGSDGSTPADRINRTGYVWRRLAENIAAGSSTAEAILDQWMGSPGHCTNIMDDRLQDLGVGYGYDATDVYRHYQTQVFATPF